MIIFLKTIYAVGFLLMAIIVIINQIMFIRLFRKLRADASNFLDSKINKYSYFDARSQFSWKVFLGNYKELENESLKKMLDRQRRFMIFGLAIFLTTIIAFILFLHQNL